MRILLASCVLLFPLAASAQEKAPIPTLQSLAWLAGDWRGTDKDMISQEVWTEPAGDCMVGSWRLVVNGILWAAGLEVPAAGVKTEFSESDLNRNLDKKDKPVVAKTTKAGKAPKAPAAK